VKVWGRERALPAHELVTQLRLEREYLQVATAQPFVGTARVGMSASGIDLTSVDLPNMRMPNFAI